jgi:mRNA interferase HigB
MYPIGGQKAGRLILAGMGVLDEFSSKHADARTWVKNWRADVSSAKWRTPQDIKLRYSTASFLSENTVIFNVKGNTYRLETKVFYSTDSSDGIVSILWAGSHADYSKRVY